MAAVSSNCWNAKDKSPLLEVTQGTHVKYVGFGDIEKDAASVHGNCAISPACGFYYFEITVLNRGREGFICVGFCGPNFSTSKLPGNISDVTNPAIMTH